MFLGFRNDHHVQPVQPAWPAAKEVSATIVRCLDHVGYDTGLFSGISAR